MDAGGGSDPTMDVGGSGGTVSMWSTDYPHSDSTWPKSREVLEAHFKDIPADERTLIAGANAAKLYGLN